MRMMYSLYYLEITLFAREKVSCMTHKNLNVRLQRFDKKAIETYLYVPSGNHCT